VRNCVKNVFFYSSNVDRIIKIVEEGWNPLLANYYHLRILISSRKCFVTTIKHLKGLFNINTSTRQRWSQLILANKHLKLLSFNVTNFWRKNKKIIFLKEKKAIKDNAKWNQQISTVFIFLGLGTRVEQNKTKFCDEEIGKKNEKKNKNIFLRDIKSLEWIVERDNEKT
jgi:hypothetical protein